MPFGHRFSKLQKHFRNTRERRLVHGAVFTFIKDHDHHQNAVVLNAIDQAVALFAQFDFVVTSQSAA